MISKALLISIGSLILFVDFAISEPLIGANNVCNKTIKVRKDFTVDEPVSYEVSYRGMCGLLPCTKTRTETRIDSKLVSTLKEVKVLACCEGYAESPDKQCLPICLNSCNNGRCVRPNVCRCSPEPTETTPGFVGSTCSRFTCLAVDKWGSKCDKECNCPTNSYCSANTGKCLCRAGWRGVNCTEECDSTSNNCDEVEPPLIIEPEANMINDRRDPLSKMEALIARDSEVQSAFDSQESTRYEIFAPYFGINIILMTLVVVLLLLLLRNRRKLNEIMSDIYSTYSSTNTSARASSTYSDFTGPQTNVQSRPRMLTPLEQDNFLGKNMTFDSATRNVLFKGEPAKQSSGRGKLVVNPIVENHLIISQRSAEQNIYSDVDPSQGVGLFKSGSTNLNDHSDSCKPSEEPEYKVPRPLSTRVEIPPSYCQSNSERNPTVDYYEGESNIYEEIQPRPPCSKKQ